MKNLRIPKIFYFISYVDMSFILRCCATYHEIGDGNFNITHSHFID